MASQNPSAAPHDEDYDNSIDVYALFILEDVPHSMINEVIQKNAQEHGGVNLLWLADSYSTLPAVNEEQRTEATRAPIDSAWRSPFLGKSLQDAKTFVKEAPKPLCRTFFAVLDKQRYEDNDEIRLCKIVDDEVQSIFYDSDSASVYFVGNDDTWEEDLQEFGGS